MPDKNIYWSKTLLTGGTAPALDSIDGTGLQDGEIAHVFVSNVLYIYRLDVDSAAAESSPDVIAPDTNAGDKRWILQSARTIFASAAEELTGAEAAKASSPAVSREMILNLKLVVNASVNKLDIFSKSGGAAPNATNPIKVMIPDGNGYTQRTRAAAYLSGTSQFIMADAANYWSKGSLDAEIKTAWLYAIWDGTGIVWALGGYSGFTAVPTTTTITDDDYFLLEDGSTYTRSASHYCVAVAKIRYQYDTGDTPDHTIQATVLDAPQVVWNPKSDYGYQKNLATTNTSASDIAAYSAVSVVVKQSGKYLIGGQTNCSSPSSTWTQGDIYIKTGSATYGSAVQKAIGGYFGIAAALSGGPSLSPVVVYLNAGDTIHLGASSTSGSAGNRNIFGDSSGVGYTYLSFKRID